MPWSQAAVPNGLGYNILMVMRKLERQCKAHLLLCCRVMSQVAKCLAVGVITIGAYSISMIG